MSAEHAVLSASGAHQWLNCPPSVRFAESLGIEDKSSVYAEEGTKAHALAEIVLRDAAGHFACVGVEEYEELYGLAPYEKDMMEYVSLYVDTCIEKLNAARKISMDAAAMIEERLDFSQWVPGGFGTGDCVIITDGHIEIIDLKYGKGVPVSAIDNPQMRLYALGAYYKYDMLYDIRSVRTTIVQPRLGSISSEDLTIAELLVWAEKIKVVAAEAYAGGGEYKAGDHCIFCKARYCCRELSEQMLTVAKYDFKDGPELQDWEVADILSMSSKVQKWLKGLDEYALDMAVSGKKYWPGYKLVAGTARRRLTDVEKIEAALTAAGYDKKDIKKPAELLGISSLESICGKKSFNEIVGEYVEKPPGKPVLVPENDKRPVLKIELANADDFLDDLL